jgi:hypothetical protein
MKVKNENKESALPKGWKWIEKKSGVWVGLPETVADMDADWALACIHSQLVNHMAYGEARLTWKKEELARLNAGKPESEQVKLEDVVGNSMVPGYYLPEKPSPRGESKAAKEHAERVEKLAAGLLAKGKVKSIEAGRELAAELLS